MRKDKYLYSLNLFEKWIKDKEKEMKNDEFVNKVKDFLEKRKSLNEIPEEIEKDSIIRYKNYIIVSFEDKYYLSTIRENKKIKNEKEILQNHKNEIEEFIEKKPASLSILEPLIKEEFEKLDIKYKKTMPFLDKLDILTSKNSSLAQEILKEYDVNVNSQLRMKRNKLSFEDIFEFEDIKKYYSLAQETLNSNELNLVKLSQLKGILKGISPIQEELKKEILENLEKNSKNEYFSKSDLVKLKNKIPENELTIFNEKLSKEIMKNEDLLKKVNADVETNNSLVIYAPFNSIKEIKELLNANKERVEVKNNIANSRFNII